MIRTLLLMVVLLFGGTVRAAETSKAPRAVLDSAKLSACVAPKASYRVSFVVFTDGSWALALPPRSDPTVLRCLEEAMSTALGADRLVAPATPVVLTRLVRGELVGGGVGSVCGYGRESPFDQLVAEPCREGLTCCRAGGAAVANSVCMALPPGGRCPPYP